MRLTVIHDIQGNIASIAASPPNSPVVYLDTKPGQQMTEIDAPELTRAPDVEQIRKHLTDLIDNHQVVIDSTKGRLAKKPGEQPKKY